MTWDDRGGVANIGVHFVSLDCYQQMPVVRVGQLHVAGWRLVPDEGQRQVEPRRRLAGQLLWPAGAEHRLGL